MIKPAIIITILILLIVTVSISMFVITTKDNNTMLSEKITVNSFKQESAKKNVSAWIAWWDEDNAIKSLNQSADKLFSVSPVWYIVNSSGDLEETAAKQKSTIIKLATQNNVRVLPTISNASSTGFDSGRLSYVFESEERTNNLIETLSQEAIEKQFDGWNIDFEEVDEKDKSNFSEFIKKLSKSLSNSNKQLTVALHAKAGKESDWKGTKGQDWKEISKHADHVQIMAYDFHSASSEPGPVTPINKYVETIKYAKQNIPIEKVIIGLPAYGYDWGLESASSITFQEAEDKASQQGVTPERDNTSHQKTYTYATEGDRHTVWYTDAVSTKKLIDIAVQEGIESFAIWRLGSEDRKMWE